MYAVKRDPPDSERLQPPQGPGLGTGLARLIVNYPGEPRGVLVGGWSGPPDMSQPRRSTSFTMVKVIWCSIERLRQLFSDSPPSDTDRHTCTRICMDALTLTHVHTHTHALTNTHTNTHTHTQMHTNRYKQVHTHPKTHSTFAALPAQKHISQPETCAKISQGSAIYPSVMWVTGEIKPGFHHPC